MRLGRRGLAGCTTGPSTVPPPPPSPPFRRRGFRAPAGFAAASRVEPRTLASGSSLCRPPIPRGSPPAKPPESAVWPGPPGPVLVRRGPGADHPARPARRAGSRLRAPGPRSEPNFPGDCQGRSATLSGRPRRGAAPASGGRGLFRRRREAAARGARRTSRCGQRPARRERPAAWPGPAGPARAQPSMLARPDSDSGRTRTWARRPRTPSQKDGGRCLVSDLPLAATYGSEVSPPDYSTFLATPPPPFPCWSTRSRSHRDHPGSPGPLEAQPPLLEAAHVWGRLEAECSGH